MDAKVILDPGRDFSRKVLMAHERIYKALAARDGAKAKKAVIQDLREVQEALLRIQKENKMPELKVKMPC